MVVRGRCWLAELKLSFGCPDSVATRLDNNEPTLHIYSWVFGEETPKLIVDWVYRRWSYT